MKFKKLYDILLMTFILTLFSQTALAQRGNTPRRNANPEIADMYISSDQETAVLEYIEKAHPFKYQEVLKIRKKRPAVYRQALVRAYREMQFARRLKEEDPARYESLQKERELETKSHELADKYKNAATEDEKQAIQKDLEKLLQNAFKIRQENRATEIENLEKKLEDLKADQEMRSSQKEKIIQKRLNELLGISDLDW